MIELSCPACGAPVAFRSKASVFAVCSFCKTTVVRHDTDLEAVGKMAELQYELTPFQIGTSGVYDKRSFQIIGRVKVAYEDGFWNEWYTIFGDDGETGWLAEAQGFLAMCFEINDKSIPKIDVIRPGSDVVMPPHGHFQVEDIRKVHCIFSEGELPVNAAQGRRSNSVDLVGANQKMATIEYADTVRAFVGTYQDFDAFKFENLRRIDGW